MTGGADARSANLVSCIRRWKIRVELRVELLPNFLWEAQSAELIEDLLEEFDLRLLQFTLGKLEQEWFSLAKIFASRLTQ